MPVLRVAAVDAGAGGRFAIPKSSTLVISRSSSRTRKMLSGFRSRCTIPTPCAFVERAADLTDDDAQHVVRGHAADALKTLAEVLAVEELHRDVRRPFTHPVIEDLDDVGAPELRRGLGLALEALLLPRGAAAISPSMNLTAQGISRPRCVACQTEPMPPCPSCRREPESLRDDHVGCELHRRSPRFAGGWSAGEAARSPTAEIPANRAYANRQDSHLRLGDKARPEKRARCSSALRYRRPVSRTWSGCCLFVNIPFFGPAILPRALCPAARPLLVCAGAERQGRGEHLDSLLPALVGVAMARAGTFSASDPR